MKDRGRETMEGGSKLYPSCLRPWIPLCMKPGRATLRLRGQYIPPSVYINLSWDSVVLKSIN